MPSPSTTDEFLELVQKSQLVEKNRLESHLTKLRTEGNVPEQPSKMAGLLVRDGIVTHFQAEQLLQGKWRRFSIGKYKVLERLGAGGMGSVYLCEHKLMRRRVAVKVLPTAKATDPAALDRFYREARAVAALDHPNIVRAYDIDNEDKLHFLVMEYVDGASLQEVIKRTGPMDVTRAAHYMRQSALGLEHASECAGLVHRDIKPGNILIDRSGIVKILDMGLARFFYDEDDDITKKYDENVLGTADYLAPEQALNSHDADSRADIYSLGATFYFCLAGKPPFADGTVAQKLIWHQTRQPAPLSTIRDDIPDGLLAVIEKMMAKERENRYQTPREVADALAAWTQTAIPAPPEAEMPKLSPAAKGPGSDSRLGSSSARQAGWEVSTSSAELPSVNAPTSPPPSSSPIAPAATSSPAPTPVSPAPTPVTPVTPATPAPSSPDVPAPTEPVAESEPPAPVRPSLLHATPIEPKPETEPEQQDAEDSVTTEEAPWEELAADTDDLTSRLETHRSRGSSRRTREATSDSPSSAPTSSKKRNKLLWAVIAGVAVIGGIVVAVLLGNNDDKPNNPGSTGKGVSEERRIVYVGGSNAKFTKIASALQFAKANDRIIVRLDSVRESIDFQHLRPNFFHNVSIEAEEGRQVTWMPPVKRGSQATDEPLLFLRNEPHGIHLKGFTFDGQLNGKKMLSNLIKGIYNCPGVILEDLTFKNYSQSAIYFANCAGTEEEPITLKNLRSENKKAPGILFQALKNTSNPPTNDHLKIIGCEFPAKPPVQYKSDSKKSAIGGNVQLQANFPRPK